MTVDVVIIGGGVSGLATAHDLKQRGHSVVVLERQAHTGGNAVSERRAGFLMEHGPSTMNAHLPVSNEISRQLGLDGQRCD
ncbi:MAG: NAD(P)/FAD-dependent oxidoreductase, partial [Alphaproteobacteria bacterium]|nr:NAD(P)/FAD-dependent oxidoreductase [Alphaproteobacteria bacterium]